MEKDKRSGASQDEQGSGSGSDTSLASFITKLEKQQAQSFSKSPLLTSKPFQNDHERNIKKIKAAQNIPESLPQKDIKRGRLPSLTISPKLQRKDSSSPETDPDFQISSSLEQEEEEVRSDCTDTSWILRQDMIEGVTVGDSMGEGWMFSKAGAKARNQKGTGRRVRWRSFIGRGSQGLARRRVRKPVDKAESGRGDEGEENEGEEEGEEAEAEEEDDKNWNINTNQISLEQAKIAAAASVLMLGMLWYCYPELRGPKFA